MMVYFRDGAGFGAEIFRQRPKGSPLAQIPVIGKLLESFGLVWGEDGALDAYCPGG